MKFKAASKTVEGKTFYYVEIGRGSYYRVEHRVWVFPEFLTKEEDRFYLTFPVSNCDLKQGKKDLVLRKGNLNLFYIFVECGFRGVSTVDEIITDDEPTIYYFNYFHSERGSTGISHGALILTKSDRVKVRWHRSGRLYGKPATGTNIFYLNGKQEEIEDESIIEELGGQVDG